MTDPATRHALLRAVLERPADDTVRLVYADYLEERGEGERAEFIRVQCEIAEIESHWLKNADGTPIPSGHPYWHIKHDALRRRERELFHADDRRTLDWFGLPRPWARIARLTPFDETPQDYPYAVVRRGFVAEVSAPLAALFGGPCGRCGGERSVPTGDPRQGVYATDNGLSYDDRRRDRSPCPACSGTGTTPGVAADLFGSQPVEKVTATDARPAETLRDWYGCRWVWESRVQWGGGTPAPTGTAHRINDQRLYDLICERAVYADGGAAGFHTADDATTALHASCVAHGRALAGLGNSAARL